MLKQEFKADGLPSMKPYLDYLLDNGAAKHVDVRWGKGHRWAIIIGGNNYQYKGGHNINKSLTNKIVSLYISMPDKSLNNNSKTSDSINVNLQFDYHPDEGRTWVNKDRFGESESDYQGLQDNSAVSTAIQIEFEMRITVRNVDNQKTVTKSHWQPLTTVYGGTHGVQLFINTLRCRNGVRLRRQHV